jgi:hypothetical protein
MTRHEIRLVVRNTLGFALLIWACMPMGMLIGHLSTMTGVMDLYVWGGIMVIGGIVVGAIAAIVIAAMRVSVALQIFWSIRNGETGPWSRWTVRARVFVALLLAQLVAVAAVGFGSAWLFPAWPAGWP